MPRVDLVELAQLRVSPVSQEGTSRTQPPIVQSVHMAPSVELRQPPAFPAKVGNTVHLAQHSVWIARKEPSLSNRMIPVLTVQMVIGAPSRRRCALNVSLDGFVATRLVVPVALQEVAVVKPQAQSVKNVQQDGCWVAQLAQLAQLAPQIFSSVKN